MPKSGKKLNIRLTRSLIGRPMTQKKIAIALGLRKSNDLVSHDDSPTIRGMVNKISHLITVEVA
ncbi:MAG: 50S ribosomal protein L30 [Vampirovibrionales bacterium]|nr:50S ribosomal protein L30 [Vampirovibrionales bacterium]